MADKQMKLVEIDFSSQNVSFSAHIDFTYAPSGVNEPRWINIISLKKNDKEASIVFRINTEKRLFLVYFGDGESVIKPLTIEIDEYVGKRCQFRYARSSDLTYFSIATENVKDVRFAIHKGKIAPPVEPKYYLEGGNVEGVIIHDQNYKNLPVDNISLSTAEAEFHGDSRLRKDLHYFQGLKSIGNSHYIEKNYKNTLSIFRDISSFSSSNFESVSFKEVRSCIVSLFSGTEISKQWEHLSSPQDVLFDDARSALIDENACGSNSLFREAVNEVFSAAPYNLDTESKDKICFAYNQLVDGFKGIVSSVLPRARPVRTIIVSGMGWSGSGAVFDYLKEFENVAAIEGETRYIEGAESLKMIFMSLHDDQLLKTRIVNFFFYALLGQGRFRNGDDFISFTFARNILSAADITDYLSSLVGWCTLASATYAASGQTRTDYFSRLSNYTVSKFTIGRDLCENEIALLDNVVHIANSSECIKFLRNTSIICTFRDPRSNYVALVREAAFLQLNAIAYVESRKAETIRAKRAVEMAVEIAAGTDDKAVEIIRFEEFVLSQKYREKISNHLALNKDSQDKYKYFKPWESMRNVTLHHEHSNQEEIELIEKELAEYCYEPCIRPLMDITKSF